MDPLQREMQLTVLQGRRAAANAQRLLGRSRALNRRSQLADAVGDRREVQAGRLQRLFDMRYDRFRRDVEDLRALQRIIQLKVRQARGKRGVLQRQARVLQELRGRILGLTRSARILEVQEQRARAISEVLRTEAINRNSNRRFAASQLPRPPPRR